MYRSAHGVGERYDLRTASPRVRFSQLVGVVSRRLAALLGSEGEQLRRPQSLGVAHVQPRIAAVLEDVDGDLSQQHRLFPQRPTAHRMVRSVHRQPQPGGERVKEARAVAGYLSSSHETPYLRHRRRIETALSVLYVAASAAARVVEDRKDVSQEPARVDQRFDHVGLSNASGKKPDDEQHQSRFATCTTPETLFFVSSHSQDRRYFEMEGSDDDDGAEEEEWEGPRKGWMNEDRIATLGKERYDGTLEAARAQYIDDLSSDDSENEETNRTGRVPLHWYEGYDHIGYDVSGEKVIGSGSSSLLDNALSSGDAWTVYDKLNGREVVLSKAEMETVRRIGAGSYGSGATEAYPDYVDYASSKVEQMPLNGGLYEPKRRFVPSKWEAMRIARIVRGIKRGTIVPKKERNREEEAMAFAETLWQDDEEDDGPMAPMIQRAPKIALPGHEESYRAPEEYEAARHQTLRNVGAYTDIVKERFERCLDLYLCPRGVKRRLNIDPETLVPKLPSPDELKPFPNALAREYDEGEGKRNMAAVVSVTASPDGQFVASLDDACTLKVWEVLTARCLRSYTLDEDSDQATRVSWNPVGDHHVIAAAIGPKIFLAMSDYTARGDAKDITEALLLPSATTEADDAWDKSGVKVSHRVQALSWHAKGDYLVSTSPTAPPSTQVMIHRLSKRRSQAPFKSKQKGAAAQAATFHPDKPYLFVATKTHVKIYHLVQQRLVKILASTCKWISSVDLHPSGDHVVVGSYDKRVNWFDLDMGTSPYKILKYHEKALRTVQFHPTLPLLASSADDGAVYVFHAQVYSDLTRNPMIVPVKKLQAHASHALDVAFHPKLPWIFSVGQDRRITLFHNL